MGKLLGINVDVLECRIVRHPRHHLEDVFQRPHLGDLVHLGKKVVVVKRIFPHLVHRFLGLFFIEVLLGLLNQGHHVPHAENP